MKKVIFTFMIIYVCGSLSSQKVDIDNFRVTISNAALPVNYVPLEDRTYSVKIGGNPDFIGANKEDEVVINGWDKVDKNAKLEIDITLGNFVRGKGVAGNKTEEKKDKDGKVLSRTTTYWYSLTNSSSGNTRFFGPKNELPKVLSVKEQEKLKEKEDKLKEKSDKKNDKKKEEIASNPFLKNVDTSKPSESSLEDVTVGNRKLAYTYSLDKQYDYKTSETTSAGAALKEYNENYGTVSNTHENDFRNSYTKWVRSYANSLYGYTPTSHWAKFKKLDSDKHPEFNMFDNATKAMKIILEKMRFNRPIGELEKDLGPILSYFEGISNKYTKDDKQEKRLRGAALYNMARIYQFLDLHDKVIEIGNTIIASEHEEKDGKKFVEESTELKRVLDFHKMKSRHIVPRNAADEKEDVGEKAKMEEEGN